MAIIAGIAFLQGWISTGSVTGGIDAISSDIEKFGAAITQGPVNTVTNAWVKIFAIAAVGGLGIWLLETKVARHEGLPTPATPGVPQLGAAPPTFSAQGGYTASAGPVTFGSGVGAGTGSPQAAPIYEVPRGGGFQSSRPTVSARERRAASQASIARSRAATAQAREQEAVANANRRGGGFVSGRSRSRPEW